MRYFALPVGILAVTWTMRTVEARAQAPDTVVVPLRVDLSAAVDPGECTSQQEWLAQTVAADPAAVDGQGRPAGLYLGRCYEAAGRTDEALAIWSQTIRSMPRAGLFEVELLETFISSVFGSRSVAFYRDACEAYLDLLVHPGDHPMVTRHLAQDALVVAPEVAAQIASSAPGGSEALVSWWRGQDPLPGSALNERLAEHLARVVTAQQRYADAQAPSGLDARGEIYVRLGEPTHRRTITLDRIGGELLRPGVTVSLADFPESEFWVYHKVDRAAHYLFARRLGRFEQAEIQDLIPDALTYGLSSDPRGQLKSEMLLATLQEIYRQMALAHQDFSSIYSQIDNYAEDRPAESIQSQRQPVVFRSDPGGPVQGATAPHLFAQRALIEGRAEDSQRRAYRDQVVPRQYSAVLESVDVLPVGVRIARVLGADGETYADVAWAPYPNGLRLPDRTADAMEAKGFDQFDRFLVDVFAVVRTADFQSHATEHRRVVMEDIAVKSDTDVPVQTLRIQGVSPSFHVGIQWDQYLVLPAPDSLGRPMKGPPVKVGVFRSDSLDALSSDPSRLEMSDLVPQFVSDPGELLSTRGARGMAPYPFDEITPESPLALTFEVYHLVLGRDDKTHYTVEYEILRRRDGGILRGEDTDRTAVATRYTGTERRSREYILVDLSDLSHVGEIVLTVRVTDVTSGQSVERSLPFTVVPAR